MLLSQECLAYDHLTETRRSNGIEKTELSMMKTLTNSSILLINITISTIK